MPSLTSTTSLAYWYRIDGAQTGILRQETDTAWSVAGRDGTPVGVVRFTTAGLLQAANYVLSDAGGTPVVGYAEKDHQLLGPDGSPVGAIADPAVWWGQEAVGPTSPHTAAPSPAASPPTPGPPASAAPPRAGPTDGNHGGDPVGRASPVPIPAASPPSVTTWSRPSQVLRSGARFGGWGASIGRQNG